MCTSQTTWVARLHPAGVSPEPVPNPPAPHPSARVRGAGESWQGALSPRRPAARSPCPGGSPWCRWPCPTEPCSSRSHGALPLAPGSAGPSARLPGLLPSLPLTGACLRLAGSQPAPIPPRALHFIHPHISIWHLIEVLWAFPYVLQTQPLQSQVSPEKPQGSGALNRLSLGPRTRLSSLPRRGCRYQRGRGLGDGRVLAAPCPESRGAAHSLVPPPSGLCLVPRSPGTAVLPSPRPLSSRRVAAWGWLWPKTRSWGVPALGCRGGGRTGASGSRGEPWLGTPCPVPHGTGKRGSTRPCFRAPIPPASHRAEEFSTAWANPSLRGDARCLRLVPRGPALTAWPSRAQP